MSSKVFCGKTEQNNLEFHAEENSVTGMSRDMTKRNMGIPTELFLAQEKISIDNTMQNNSEIN